jgi:hypothetical protein
MTSLISFVVQKKALYVITLGRRETDYNNQIKREKVATTKITTLKTKKNIEKFANHHNVENGS